MAVVVMLVEESGHIESDTMIICNPNSHIKANGQIYRWKTVEVDNSGGGVVGFGGLDVEGIVYV